MLTAASMTHTRYTHYVTQALSRGSGAASDFALRNEDAQLGTSRCHCVCSGYDVTPLECADRRGARCGGGERGGSGAPAVRRATSLLLAPAQHGSPGATRNCSTSASVAYATKSRTCVLQRKAAVNVLKRLSVLGSLFLNWMTGCLLRKLPTTVF